jgi:hypothetical protein
MKQKAQEKVSEANIEQMSLYELCRWSALEEAINLISDKCEERGVTLKRFN